MRNHNDFQNDTDIPWVEYPMESKRSKSGEELEKVNGVGRPGEVTLVTSFRDQEG